MFKKYSATKKKPAATAKSSSKKSVASASKINVAVDKDSSISISKIENGFLISESGEEGKGKNRKWYTKQYYSKDNPVKIATSGVAGKPTFGAKKQ